MTDKRKFFTSEGYRRLEQNPFVDRNMLQFIREKWRGAARSVPPGQRQVSADVKSPAAGTGVSGAHRAASPQKTQLSEKAVHLMSETIKSMLREQ